MLLSKPFKKKVRMDDDSSLYRNRKDRDEEGGKSNVADWACTDASKFKRLSKDAKTEGKRAPELWIPDGESRLVRYVDDEPIASFKRYSFKHNGKWRQFVAPPEGKTDLFATQLGLKAQRVFLFRVIDINGYKDKKKGKTYRNLARFQVASTRAFDQISMMSEENSDAGALNEYNVKISRSGTGTNTTYLYMPRQVEKLTPEMKKAIDTFPKFTDYYKPLSRQQQEAIVASHGGGNNSDDDDND